MIKIAAVSYINTLPFIYGIKNSGFLNKKEYQIQTFYPSLCTEAFYHRHADIVLLPIGSFQQFPDDIIITSYCISSHQHVKSVLMVGNEPIEKIKKIWLDYQSTTSVKLLQILLKHHWNKNVELLAAKAGYEQQISGETGGLIIGDRAMELSHHFAYTYDLSYEWWKLTKLPFVFACWAKTTPISEDFLSRFEKSLQWGIEHKELSLSLYKETLKEHYLRYLNENIIYTFDEYCKSGLIKFFELLQF